MASVVQTYGPKEGLDPTGEIDVFYYFAEARGTDGNYHRLKTYAARTPYVEFMDRQRELTGSALEQRMREEGVWSDDEQG